MTKNRFTDRKRHDSVAYALAHPERSIQTIAADLGIGYSTLDRWLHQARSSGLGGAQRQLTPNQLLIRQLEKEVAHLRGYPKGVMNYTDRGSQYCAKKI